MKINSTEPLSQTLVAATPAPRMRLAWSDFHTVLTVARLASVAKASEVLAVTHATLLRKLAAIEGRLNTRLFDRVRGHYTLTAPGEEIMQAAISFEPLAREAEMRVLGLDMRPSGQVRVAVASIVIDYLLPPLMAQFAALFPDVSIELIASRDHVSLARREADVAIRVSDHVPDWLVGNQLGVLTFKIYGLKNARVNEGLHDPAELATERRWISFERDARDLKFDRWLDRNVPDTSVVLRIDNFSHALTMVRAGLGIALLPSFLENTCPDLQPLTTKITELQTPLWLVTHQELRNAMRVKVLMQFFGLALATGLNEESGRLA